MVLYPRFRVLPAEYNSQRGRACYSVVPAWLSVGVGVYVC